MSQRSHVGGLILKCLFIPQTMYLRRAAAEKMKRLLSLGLVTPKVFGFLTYLSIETGTVEFVSKRHQDTRVLFCVTFPSFLNPGTRVYSPSLKATKAPENQWITKIFNKILGGGFNHFGNDPF